MGTDRDPYRMGTTVESMATANASLQLNGPRHPFTLSESRLCVARRINALFFSLNNDNRRCEQMSLPARSFDFQCVVVITPALGELWFQRQSAN